MVVKFVSATIAAIYAFWEQEVWPRMWAGLEHAWSSWCRDIWPHIEAGFEQVAYYPSILGVLSRTGRTGATFLVFSILTVTILYALSCIILSARWRQMYYGLRVRRPAMLAPFALIAFCIYAGAVFYPSSQSFHVLFDFLLKDVDRMYFKELVDLRAAYERGPAQFSASWNFWQQKFESAAAILFLAYFYPRIFSHMFYISGDNHHYGDDWLEYSISRPVTLRVFFNFWARRQHRFSWTNKAHLEQELEPFSTNAEALAQAEIDAKQDEYDDYLAEQAKLLHFNIVMHTYIPVYYDPHPVEPFADLPDEDAFLVEEHQNNFFHSA